MDDEWLSLACEACGNVGLDNGNDGFFYCSACGSQAEDIIETGVADEDFINKGGSGAGGSGSGAIYLPRHRRHTYVPLPLHQSIYESKFWNQLDEEGAGATDPSGDFGGLDELRMRYVMGIQLMIEFQCEALVAQFGASPLVCGLAGTIWLRFVSASRIFTNKWADDAFDESENKKPGEAKVKQRARYSAQQPVNIHGQRAVMIWYRCLSKKIPLCYSLVISFLACHIAREAILPTDILKWSLEGKLPYFASFVDIEKHIGQPTSACPLLSRVMFKPSQLISLQKLESMAASVAQSIGMHLPPVNFYLIASRYLKDLSLPTEKILGRACRLYEWSMPPELWLSTNESRLPTRVFVLSILIVAIRIVYDIHGFGDWEMSLSSNHKTGKLNPRCRYKQHDNLGHKMELGAAQLLQNLEQNCYENNDPYEFSADLPSYLQYCKDVVFVGLEPHREEGKIIEKLWDFYQNQKDRQDHGMLGKCEQKRSRDDENDVPNQSKKKNEVKDDKANSRVECLPEDKAIARLKLDMEENRFCYIPPRINVKRFGYLHYARKKDEGDMIYVAHADYYILLRACASVAQVDVRNMHAGVLSLERRLDWFDRRIRHSLSKCFG